MGDVAFDRATYLACDHPVVGRILRTHDEARRAITALFAAVADGDRCLWHASLGAPEGRTAARGRPRSFTSVKTGETGNRYG